MWWIFSGEISGRFTLRKKVLKFVIEDFEHEICGGFVFFFVCRNFRSIFSQENSLKLCRQNFTTFFGLKFTISEAICRPVFTLGVISQNGVRTVSEYCDHFVPFFGYFLVPFLTLLSLLFVTFFLPDSFWGSERFPRFPRFCSVKSPHV